MRILTICIAILLCGPVKLTAQIIKSIAGACATHLYDGVPAQNADLGDNDIYPVFDAAGNMYLLDDFGNTIRRVDATTGIVTIIAGTENVMGYTGDGGPAKNALIYHPCSIAIDNSGNIFFADQVGIVIRKITPGGIISTVSGPYLNLPCTVGDGGPFSGASFQAIVGMAFDPAGNLYISDMGCDVIRKVNTNGIVTTVAGNGTQGFSGDGGLATLAQMNYPCKVAFDAAGNMYIPDAQNNRVRRVDATTGIIETVAGTGILLPFSGDGGPATSANLFYPASVTFDNTGNLYIGGNDYRIRRVDPAGIITTYAGTGTQGSSGDGGLAQDAEINLPNGFMSADINGNIYICNLYSCNVREIPTCPTPLTIKYEPNHVQLCTAGTATFKINATNGTSFRWQVNDGSGWNNLSNDAVYSGVNSDKLTILAQNTALDSYQYRCEVINTCGRLTSVPDTLSISTPDKPSIEISVSSNPICSGESVSYFAVSERGGTTPTYQWLKNGVNVGFNSPRYTDIGPANNDQIVCILTSNDNCITQPNAVSNAIILTVATKEIPTIRVQPASSSICPGDATTFKAVAENVTNTPTYQWSKNDLPVGTNASSYTDASLQDNDRIFCTLITTDACSPNTPVISNTVTVRVSTSVEPSVNITGQNQVCPGKPVVFQAELTSGTGLTYEWFKNSSRIGGSDSRLSDNAPVSGDIYYCTVKVGGTCVAASIIISNKIVISVVNPPKPLLDPNLSLCAGNTLSLDPGTFDAYLWDDGSTERTRLISVRGDYSVTVTDKNGCSATASAKISSIVDPPQNFIITADTSICPYSKVTIKAKPGFKSYLWNDFSTSATLIASKPGYYILEVSDTQNCIGKDSILVNEKSCVLGFHIPNAFTPNGDGKNDRFKPVLNGNIVFYDFQIWNRWGQIVFESRDIENGWDGSFNGLPQDTNTFTWACIYQLEGEIRRNEKGTFVLIR